MKKTQSELESRIVTGAHGVAAEEDHLKLGKVVAVGAGALLLFAIGGFAAYGIMVRSEREAQPDGPAPTPAAIGQYEIGIVNQRLFDVDSHALSKISAQQLALKNGWGERPGQVVHMPLDQAMDAVIAAKGIPPVPAVQSPPSTPPAPAPQSKRNPH
jgi:hypothetical protein